MVHGKEWQRVRLSLCKAKSVFIDNKNSECVWYMVAKSKANVLLKCHMCIDNKNSECVWYMVAKSKAKSVFC